MTKRQTAPPGAGQPVLCIPAGTPLTNRVRVRDVTFALSKGGDNTRMRVGIAAGLVVAVLSCSTAQQPTEATSPATPGRVTVGPDIPLLDRTEATFRLWRHVGGGEFVRLPDGTVEGRGPLGMLWYPLHAWGDVVVKLQWRSAGRGICCANSGVFIRFPDPEQAVADPSHPAHRCQRGIARTQPAWVAVFCGQEVQINDGRGDPQATGSVYNFRPVSLGDAGSTRNGVWNDLEIRITGAGDYAVVVTRNGRVINRFRNSPGQAASRSGDPGTSDRQFATGFLGLQNHDGPDVVQFRDVRVQDLDLAGPR
jgi:hypothetical protein